MPGLQTKRERLLMGATAVAVLFGGGYFFAFQPIYAHYEKLDSKITSRQVDWKKNKERFIQSKLLRTRFERIRESLSLEGNQQQITEQISEELTRLLEEYNIIYSTQSGGGQERIEKTDFVIYTYDLKGIRTTWEALAAFLYAIETNPAVLEIKKVNIRRSSNRTEAQDGMVQAEVSISRVVENPLKKRGKRSRKKR